MKDFQLKQSSFGEGIPEEPTQYESANDDEVSPHPSRTVSSSTTTLGSSVIVVPKRDARKSFVRTFGFTPADNPHIYSKWEKRQMKNYRSIVYHNSRSQIYLDFLLSSTLKSGMWWKWFFFVAIGIMMSFTAYVLKTVTEVVNERRKEFLAELLFEHQILEAYFFHISVSLAFILISSSIVIFWEPSASGSGIPEVIGYLNGVHISNIFTPKVYVAKMVSVISSVASGLPVGPEGPMIHIGGTIGASVESQNTVLQKLVPWYQFRNQEDKRQFVLGGVAAGVSAAFNAPIGGLAFAWEEISTFWEDKAAWMILFGCMFSAFVTNLLLSITFDTPHSGYFTRGTILFFVPSVSSLGVWVFIPAIFIGIIGGILGVIFTRIALFFGKLRRRKIFQNSLVKLLEPCLISVLFMSIGFFFPYAFPCIPENESAVSSEFANETTHLASLEETSNISNESYTKNISTWICPEGFFNPMAELTLQPGHEIIKEMLSRENVGAFSFVVLVAFLIYYFLFAAWCAGGVSIASGFVVPMITVGATYGRIIGKVMLLILSQSETNTPGLYALLGSAAFFAGVTRLSVSLTIIMIELSGDVLMAFPLMVSIMVAKNFADIFTHPLYHAQLALKGVPYLEECSSLRGMETLRVSDVMTPNVIHFHDVEVVANLVDFLEKYDFSAFPVVSKDMYYEGMIQRKELKYLLSQPQIFVNKPSDRPSTILTWFEVKQGQNLQRTAFVSNGDMNKHVDLSPYVNTGIFSVPLNFFLKDAYTLFRTMALTHIIVVNQMHQLVGIITRKDLLGEIVTKRVKKTMQIKDKIKRALKKDKDSLISGSNELRMHY